MADEHPEPRTYTIVFLSLLALLALTVSAAFLDFDRWLPMPLWNWSIAIALGIAIAKGVLIMLYFMHVKSGPRRAVVFAGAGFLWLGILLVLTMSDYLTRNHPPGLNPKGEPRYLDVPRRGCLDAPYRPGKDSP